MVSMKITIEKPSPGEDMTLTTGWLHMDDVSFVVPFRSSGDKYRDMSFEWGVRRLESLFPDSEVIVSDDDGNTHFNRSQARNNGAKKATKDILAFVDSDTIFNVDTMNLCAHKVRTREHTWMIPYRFYERLDKDGTDDLLSKNPDIHVKEHHYKNEYTWDNFSHPGQVLAGTVSGLVVMPRHVFHVVGGYCEHFKKWGFEDRAIVAAANRWCGLYTRLPGSVFHLWHEESPQDTTKNDMFIANEARYADILDASDYDHYRSVYGVWT